MKRYDEASTILQQTKRYDEAQNIYTTLEMGNYETLKIYKEVEEKELIELGSTHRDYLITKHNIACCLREMGKYDEALKVFKEVEETCLLYTSPSPRDATLSRMPSSA